MTLLLPLAILAPLALLASCIWPQTRRRVPGMLWLAPLPALLAAWVMPPPLVLDAERLRFTLALDPPAALLLGACALLWSIAGIHARLYLGRDAAAQRFAAWWLVTQAGSLGVFIAGDLLSFYLLFAAVSLPAWGLIAHDGTLAARRAAATTLLLAVLGEVALLLGFALLADAVPGPSIAIADAMAHWRAGKAPDLALGLLLAGFGLKAGLVPLHVWLPLAHPAAPMPASAVLSGAIVKAGLIGLLRFLPPDQTWGLVLCVIGFVTAYWGVACGVVQRNPKAILAYSTISQMGLLTAALGLGGGAMAALPVAFAAIGHVLAKGALFLAVACGARPVAVLLPALVLALGFGGAPLTAGALGKAATKPLLDQVGLLAAFAAAGSTLLMVTFLRRLAAVPRAADARLLAPWLALAAAAVVLPWMLFPGDPLAAVLDPASMPPVLTGATIALMLPGFEARLPRVPEGDIIQPLRRLARPARALGAGIAAVEAALRAWPAAGVSLLLLGAAVLGAVLLGAR
jgi:formate hydrogenlyase subunit 3/multisubunit Na+/H+ antiporter MnhD subunit